VVGGSRHHRPAVQLLRQPKGRKRWLIAGLTTIILLLPGCIWWLRHGHHLRYRSPTGLNSPRICAWALCLSWRQLESNFGGQALLNALYVIMLVLGLLMALIRRRQLGWLALAWVGSIVH